MAAKTIKKSKSSEASQLTQTVISKAKNASKVSPTRASSEEDSDIGQPVWEKMVQSAQNELLEKIGVVEERMNTQDGRTENLEHSVLTLEQDFNLLRLKVDDLEGHTRRNNIRIVGVPEREEGGKPTEFVEKLLLQLLGETNFQTPLVIDRAHRTLKPWPPEGANPRPIIARIHFCREEEQVLRLRRNRELEYKGRKVLVFMDYTPEVMRQRQGFKEVLRSLRES